MIQTLIVDDSQVFRLSLGRMLSSVFPYMRIGEAASLHDAVLQARLLRADLVFADVRLPDGNGLDLPRFLAPMLPHAQVCIVTSYDLPEYKEAAREAGACCFLAKSDSTASEVMNVVHAALARRAPVLVVDDHDLRRAAFVNLLATRWPLLLPFGVADMAAALAVARAVQPELTFARMELFEGSGAWLAPAIRSMHPRMQVVPMDEDLSPRIDGIAAAVQAVLSQRAGPRPCRLTQDS